MKSITDKEQELIREAEELISQYGDGFNHTVAAATLDSSGKVYKGLNLYHFTGGPCAEIVAISNALSSGVKSLTTLVAVGDQKRGVLVPCGRCRQILLDYFPSIEIIISSQGKLGKKPISDLLQDAYYWKEQLEDNRSLKS